VTPGKAVFERLKGAGDPDGFGAWEERPEQERLFYEGIAAAAVAAVPAVADMLSSPAPGYGTKLEALAHVLDHLDRIRGVEGETEMQDDLRRWDAELRAMVAG